MTFEELHIGQTFDWINPHSFFNSFFLRCTKISGLKYEDSKGRTHKVGTITATVYHVIEKEQQFRS